MLKNDITRILDQFGESLVGEIIQNMEATGAIATGATSNSLRWTANGTTLEIYGGKAFIWMETGRGPTKPGASSGEGDETLREKLEKWIKARGIETEEKKIKSMSYALSKKIHEEGTALYRSGGVRLIYSNVITPRRMKALGSLLSGAVSLHVKSELLKSFT
jgi:hypothetical protein